MITICIPVYNFNISDLIEDLSKQLKKLSANSEIIIIDDGSTAKIKNQNKSICSNHQYIELSKNIGRSKIRNLFLKYAQYENLLFLDCDSLIITENFISTYIDYIIKNDYDVVFGGRIYPEKSPDKSRMLSYKYGSKIESQTYNQRILTPYKSFMSNNFLVKKNVLTQVPFDETLTEYGHEDTLFSYHIKKNNLVISHLDNPILNGDIETNIHFLQKTEKSIKNIYTISNKQLNDNDFVTWNKILRYHQNLKRNKLISPLHFIFKITKPIIKFTLLNGCVNLALFNFYKLGVLMEQKQ